MTLPYDLPALRSHLAPQLRHPRAEVAKWAGHSVEVLTRIYTSCVAGLDERVDQPDGSLGNGDNSAQRGAWLAGTVRTCGSAWECVEHCQT
jgi:hypothetical protein